MLLPALLLLLQDAPDAVAISQMEQRFAACGFPAAHITVNAAMETAAVTLAPAAEPADDQLDCAARLMVAGHLFPGSDTPPLAERLRPFLIRAMQGSPEEERQTMIERNNLGPAVASLTPLRHDARALERRLIALCGPETRKLIRTITPPGGTKPILDLHPAPPPPESARAASKARDEALLCVLQLSTAADLGLGFLGNAAKR